MLKMPRNLVFKKLRNIYQIYDAKKVIVPFLKIIEDNGKITLLRGVLMD